MVENSVRITTHLEIAAQKIIEQLILNNELIEEQIESGVKKALTTFDFEAEVQKATEEAIRREIKNSSNWDKLSKLVREKASKIVDDHIEKHMQILRDNL